MSMSTRIVGFKLPDEKWRAMKAVRDSCIAAGVPVPQEVESFFEFSAPDDNGVKVDLKNVAKEWISDNSSGIDIDLRKVPSDVMIIRFYNSW